MLNARRFTRVQRYGLFVLVALLGSAWIYWSRVPIDMANPAREAAHTNFRAPAFSLNSLDGKRISLDDVRGRVVLVNFWATWCVPCRTEMPAIQAVYQSYGADDLAVLAINMGEDEGSVRQFVDEFRLTFPVLLDREFQVTGLYEVQGLPTSIFINRSGIIRATSLGGMNRASIEAEINKLLEPGR